MSGKILYMRKEKKKKKQNNPISIILFAQLEKLQLKIFIQMLQITYKIILLR